MPAGPLGRRDSPDDRHKLLFSASAVPFDVIRGSGGVFGIPWFSNFDNPVKDNGDHRWWIGRGNLGHVRGGHAICGHTTGVKDIPAWRVFYDQGKEWPGKPDKDYSSCVGMSVARYASTRNRVRYDAYDIYHWAQDDDPWEGNDYEGTDLRSGFECLRVRGPRRVLGKRTFDPDPTAGIDVYRWAENVDQIRMALNVPDWVSGCPMINSWGPGFPHIVWMPDEVVDRVVFGMDGEFGIVTDR